MKNNTKNRLRTEESIFLRGPLSRFKELFFTFRVQFSFVKAFRKMHFIGPCVTVFGSARFDEANPYYVQAEAVGAALANLGFTVMTGGGPGLQHIQIMAENESISPEDMELIFVTDSVEEMAEHIRTHAIEKFKLKPKPQKPKWWFGESA